MAKVSEQKKSVTLYSPKGTKVTVGEGDKETYTKKGYSASAPKS